MKQGKTISEKERLFIQQLRLNRHCNRIPVCIMEPDLRTFTFFIYLN